jgi:hypothetical protein
MPATAACAGGAWLAVVTPCAPDPGLGETAGIGVVLPGRCWPVEGVIREVIIGSFTIAFSPPTTTPRKAIVRRPRDGFAVPRLGGDGAERLDKHWLRGASMPR